MSHAFCDGEECIHCMRAAVELALLILDRDGIRPLEGLAFTQDEREELERAAGVTAAQLVAEANEAD